MSKTLTLVLGGVRSGKSSYAQNLARDGDQVLFVATAEAGDEDMASRIARHRADRPSEWHTLEEPMDLINALMPIIHRYDTILLDCLTLWVSNLLLNSRRHVADDIDILTETRKLLQLCQSTDASWILVSNEVGLGVAPVTNLGNAYADVLGQVNQIVTAEADDVCFMVAGIPLKIKSATPRG